MTSELYRERRWLLWVGLTAFLVLTLLWVIGMYSSVYYSGVGWGCAVIEAGQVRIYMGSTSGGGWLVYANDPAPAIRWYWPKCYYSSPTSMGIELPLWIPMLVVGVPTVLSWHRSRPVPGHCQKCGYNLAGLPEPRCPECGTEFDPPRSPAPEAGAEGNGNG